MLRRSSMFLVVTTFAVVGAGMFPVAANADQWAPVSPSVSANQVAVTVSDQTNVEPVSMITAGISDGSSNFGDSEICTSVTTSGPCDVSAPGSAGGGLVLLPICATSVESNCIVSVSLGTAAATMTPATYIRPTQGPAFAGIPELNIPEGSTIGLWQSSVANAAGTTTYAADVALSFSWYNGVFSSPTLSAQIEPYSQISGPFFSAPQPFVTTDSTGKRVVETIGTVSNCAWTETGTCGLKEDFAPGTVASMAIRVSDSISGWFFGRLQSPSLSVERFDATSQIVTVSGQAVSVPVFEATSSYSTPSPAFQTFFASQTYQQPLFSGLLEQVPADGPNAFTAVDDLRATVNNTASGVATAWVFNTFPSDESPCMSANSTILGLVTTNAMAYDGSPPAFINGFLEYHVAGMHYLPDGSVASGTYDMIMADSVARCLYGFTNAPISATIAVTENSGVENVATTSVSDSGGWLHLGAYNFNFSDPVITMQLKQAPVAKVRKLVTLTCVKGPSKRIVRGVRPHCPTGYQVHR